MLNSVFVGSGNRFESEIQAAKGLFKGKQIREFTGHTQSIQCVAWNPAGDRLATGSKDKTVRVWSNLDRKHNKESLELTGHTGVVSVARWNPTNNEQLATTSLDSSLRLWDARTGQCTSRIGTPGEGINLAWSPCGNVIACGNKMNQLLHIDVRKMKLVKIIKFHYFINEMTWNPEGTNVFLCTGGGDIEVRSWPDFVVCMIPVAVLTVKKVKTINAHTTSLFSISTNPNGRNLAVGSQDSIVSLWDTKEYACIRTFSNLTHMVRTISISHDGQYIASGSEDPFIDISHIDSGENVATIACDATTNGVAWNPKRHLLAFGGDYKDKYEREGTLKIFGFDS